jgi:hypothetical protein
MDKFETLKIEFFKDKKGKQPVEIWLKGFPLIVAKSIYRDILAASYRNMSGKNKYQIASQIEKNLWQIYNSFANVYILFTIDKDVLVLLDGFTAPNNKDKAGGKHLIKARKRLGQYREVNNGK